MAYLSYISDENLKKHIKETIKKYGDTLKSVNLAKFNKNIIDPIKLTFDSKVYDKSLNQIIVEELARQRDKTNTNAIGYFHQNLFKYIKSCEVPQHGFDVIFQKDDGNKVYVEMKNKHNTMNSSSSAKTFMKLSTQAANEPNCECFLVEVISKKSQLVEWKISLDGEAVSSPRIKKASIDKFYSLVTGEKNAFYNLCNILPTIIDEILLENQTLGVEEDTVFNELQRLDNDLIKSLFLLAFKTYEGFH